MKKGTLTPNEMGGFDLEIKNVSSDWKEKMISTAITLGMAALTGIATYFGQYAAATVAQKLQERSAKKKEEQK